MTTDNINHHLTVQTKNKQLNKQERQQKEPDAQKNEFVLWSNKVSKIKTKLNCLKY